MSGVHHHGVHHCGFRGAASNRFLQLLLADPPAHTPGRSIRGRSSFGFSRVLRRVFPGKAPSPLLQVSDRNLETCRIGGILGRWRWERAARWIMAIECVLIVGELLWGC